MNTLLTRIVHRSFCHFCGKAIAVSSNGAGVLADHGFQVPGNGMRIGACTGQGMKPVELSTIQIEVAIRQNEAFLASVPARKERIANTEFKMEWQRHQEERNLENKIQSAEANLFVHRQSLANWTQRELWIVDEIREAAEKKDAVKTTRKASLEAKIEKHMAKYARLDKSTAKRIAELPTWVPAERIARAEENQWNTHQEELRRLQFEEKQLREKLALMF
jgi:hypothetical protein